MSHLFSAYRTRIYNVVSKGFGPGFNSTSPQSEIMHNSSSFGLLGFDLRLIYISDATTASEGRTSTLADTKRVFSDCHFRRCAWCIILG